MTINYINSKFIKKRLFIVFFFINISTILAQTTPANAIVGKVVCGYQGWFNCAGDGSPSNSWRHWSANVPIPRAGQVTIEYYPDTRIYDQSVLFQTGLADTAEGSKSKLFSSYTTSVIGTHFDLMKKHGIDGVALQRFATEVTSGNVPLKQNRDTIAARVKRAAEKNARIFYIMYDMSGLSGVNFGAIKTDWINTIIGALKLTSSNMYARQNAKPVVCIWGIGFGDRDHNQAQSLEIINWFKQQGCYVIGGVPAYWRTGTADSKPDFETVYKAFDMLSPWAVGRFGTLNGALDFKTNNIVPDKQYCDANNIAYQPVVFSGFAWSNWNGGNQNAIPRLKGEFLWRQVSSIKEAAIPSMYVAMFDEYDEATAILNAADSYYMAPTDQYFLTNSADGTYLSSDFYMRLVGEATKVIHNSIPLSPNVNIPYALAPMFFRTSMEQNYDATPTWTSTSEDTANIVNVGGSGGSGTAICANSQEQSHIGKYAIKCSGSDNSITSSHAYFKVFDVNIPVEGNTYLSFWSNPQNALSRYVSVDLIMTDGTTLRDSGAKDINGVYMHPAEGRGVVNTWTNTKSKIGTFLNGKTIDRIVIAFDRNPDMGDFTTYFDDISIYNDANSSLSINSNTNTSFSKELLVYPNPSHSGLFQLSESAHWEIYSILGVKIKEGKDMLIDLSSESKGLYFLKSENKIQKIIIVE
jgi:hypothetical protein